MNLNSPSLIFESRWFKLAAWTWTSTSSSRTSGSGISPRRTALFFLYRSMTNAFMAFLSCKRSNLAEAFRTPIGRGTCGRLRRVVQDQNQSATHVGARRRKLHGRPLRHDDGRSSSPADERACRCFETGLAGERVPGFRSGMSVDQEFHPRPKDRFHVLRSVGDAARDGERTNSRDGGSLRRSPARISNSEQPHRSERLNDLAVRKRNSLCRGTGRESR